MPEPLLTRYLQPLLAGRRAECFRLIAEALDAGTRPEHIACDVVWPAMLQLDRLFRDDRIDAAINNMAARINRTVADQLQAHLPCGVPNGRRLVVVCSDELREGIGAEILSDLFQAEGWDVYLLGADVPHDELLHTIGKLCPHALLIYGSQPHEIPNVRRLVEMIREIGVCPTMNIVAGGGVYGRVDALWQEIGADAVVCEPREALHTISTLEPAKPGRRPLGIVKKRRRKRKVAV